jgi:hypothetical protein
MRVLRVILTVLLLLGLMGASCGQTKPPAVPQVVRVVVEVPKPVPPELTAPCYDEPARNQSLDEAVRLANLRRESLAECSGRMKQIRERR